MIKDLNQPFELFFAKSIMFCMSEWVEIFKTKQSWEALMVYNALEKKHIQAVIQELDPVRGIVVCNPAMLVDFTNTYYRYVITFSIGVMDNQLEKSQEVLEELNFSREEMKRRKEADQTHLSKEEFDALSRKALWGTILAVLLLFVLPYLIVKLFAYLYR